MFGKILKMQCKQDYFKGKDFKFWVQEVENFLFIWFQFLVLQCFFLRIFIGYSVQGVCIVKLWVVIKNKCYICVVDIKQDRIGIGKGRREKDYYVEQDVIGLRKM